MDIKIFRMVGWGFMVVIWTGGGREVGYFR